MQRDSSAPEPDDETMLLLGSWFSKELPADPTKLSLGPDPQPRWRPTRRQVQWSVGVVATLVVSILIGYRYDITLWDWMKLLVVPAVLAGGGLWFNAQQRDRELQIADERAQDEALQAYLDGMSLLLTDKERPLHRARPGDSLSSVARARTITVLPRLGGDRKGYIVRFLYEVNLIAKDHPVLSLSGANLSEVDLNFTDMSGADLSGARLIRASLIVARLGGANLSEAKLKSARLGLADLSGANLRGANLREAVLGWARLEGADLRDANLEKTPGLTYGQIAEAKSLDGATMPDGEILRSGDDPNGLTLEDWVRANNSKRVRTGDP